MPWLAAALVLLVVPGGAVASPRGESVSRRVLAMGTWLDLEVVASDRDTAARASEAAIEAVERSERRLSTWRADTELAALNRAPSGRWHRVSPELARDLGDAVRCSQWTGGGFSPALGRLVSAWDLRGLGRQPAAAEIAALADGLGAEAVTVRGAEVLRRGDVAVIEEGGFGKGAALRDAAAAVLAADARCAWFDFGGQVTVAGGCEDRAVAIASPVDRRRLVGSLRLGSGSVATSGGSERSVSLGGDRLHHVLDPRTGAPIPDWGTVTVLTPDPLVADCLATGLLVLGPDEALVRGSAEPGVEVVVAVARTDGETLLRATSGLRGRLTAVDGVELEWHEAAPRRVPARPGVHD